MASGLQKKLMTFFIIPILGLILFSFMASDELFERCFQALKSLLNLLKKRFLHLRGLYEISQGEALVQEINAYGLKGPVTLPEYKFYTDLILTLLKFLRQLGAPYKKIFSSLKKDLTLDLQFEKKLLSELTNGLFQFCTCSALIFLFIFLSQKIAGLNTDIAIKILILVIQVLGLAFYFFFYHLFKKKDFSSFEKYFKCLYSFRSLFEISLPLQKLVDLSNIVELYKVEKKEFSFINERIYAMLYKLKSGMSISEELAEIIGELKFLQEQKFELFLKKMSFLKFLTLSLFFLSSYLIFILSFLQHSSL